MRPGLRVSREDAVTARKSTNLPPPSPPPPMPPPGREEQERDEASMGRAQKDTWSEEGVPPNPGNILAGPKEAAETEPRRRRRKTGRREGEGFPAREEQAAWTGHQRRK